MKSKRKYLDLKQPLRHVPTDILSIKVNCKSCNFDYEPNWLEKGPSPFIPSELFGDGVIWRPTAAQTICTNCGSGNLLEIPYKELENSYFLYGDEAFRSTEDHFIICYSLVGTNFNFVPFVEERINSFKRSIFPDLNPSDWTLHMMEIWSPDKRKKPLFKDFTNHQIHNLVNDYFELIKNLENGFVIFCTSAIANKPKNISKKFLKEIKTDVYSLLFTQVIRLCTDQKSVPFFTFDAEKVGKSEHVIHEWVESAFVGAQHSLLYTFISGGAEIEEPRFVKPGSHPCLEIADFVSYVVARYLFKKTLNQKVDLNPQNLGYVMYSGFINGGDFYSNCQDSYPWELFYE